MGHYTLLYGRIHVRDGVLSPNSVSDGATNPKSCFVLQVCACVVSVSTPFVLRNQVPSFHLVCVSLHSLYLVLFSSLWQRKIARCF